MPITGRRVLVIINKMNNPQRNLFLDYGELIVRYHFSPKIFNRAHAIAQNRINSVNGYNVSLDQVRNAHKTSVQEYLVKS